MTLCRGAHNNVHLVTDNLILAWRDKPDYLHGLMSKSILLQSLKTNHIVNMDSIRFGDVLRNERILTPSLISLRSFNTRTFKSLRDWKKDLERIPAVVSLNFRVSPSSTVGKCRAQTEKTHLPYQCASLPLNMRQKST
ncbi:uncharacterized protein PHALS_11620 [Plasmopara halstedii]|uniref:Uncharacterized protein n=1 Tax=Plasmopara halstedii TaxID=4781 RepID=A0A0P1AKB7_PLAHL|nr:uncharacterized protein PHALS_11620 [Plasmopara halstedii]CEG41261.1 hypothetical protein PHALS_11620 [Plasmopara halstedii]|eukprot:XP_024577630.1 hypothetical protein PHALS_11620 [Plasmopara halstedii]